MEQNLNQDPPKKSVKEFAAAVRNKSNAYHDVPDEELVRAYVKKNPTYESQVDWVGKSQSLPKPKEGKSTSPSQSQPKKSGSGSTNGSSELEALLNKPSKSTPEELEKKSFKAQKGMTSPSIKEGVSTPVAPKPKKFSTLDDISKINTSVKEGKTVDEIVAQMGASDPDEEARFRQDAEKYIGLKNEDLNFSDYNYAELSKSNEDDTTDRLYSKDALTKAGFNPDDFDGFMESTGRKADLKSRVATLNDWTENLQSGDVDLKYDQQRFKDFNAYYQDVMLKKSDELAKAKVAMSLGNTKAKEAYDKTYNDIMTYQKGYQNYISDNFKSLDVEIKKNKEKVKQQYKEYKNGDGAWFSNAVKNTWNTVEQNIGGLSAFVYDKVGMDSMAEGVRMANESEKLSNETSNMYYSYGEGKTGEHNGSNYLVKSNGQIYDTDLKIDVTQALDDSEYDNIVKASSSWKDGSSFSLGGTTQQVVPVLADMAIQIALTKGIGRIRGGLQTAVAESSIESTVLRQLGKTEVGRKIGTGYAASTMEGGLVNTLVNKTSKIPAHYVDVIAAQSTYGYAQAYETTLSALKKEGYEDDKAKELASLAGEQMAVLYGVTGLINPQTKLFGVLENKSVENAIRGSLNVMKTEGREGFIKSLGEATKNLFKTQNITDVIEEGGKEALQENIQQYGETEIVNRNINEAAGQEILKQDYTVEDFVNTTALSMAAGVMMNSPLMSRGTDKLQLLSQLSDNKENFDKSIDNFVKQGMTTPEQASKLKADVEIFSKYRNQIPKEVANEVAWEVMTKLDKIDQETIRKNNSHEMFKDAHNQVIEGLKNEVNEIIKTKKIDFQDTDGRYTKTEEAKTDSGETTQTEVGEEVVPVVQNNTTPVESKNTIDNYNNKLAFTRELFAGNEQEFNKFAEESKNLTNESEVDKFIEDNLPNTFNRNEDLIALLRESIINGINNKKVNETTQQPAATAQEEGTNPSDSGTPSWSIEEGGTEAATETGGKENKIVADAKSKLYSISQSVVNGDVKQAITDAKDLIASIAKTGVISKTTLKTLTASAIALNASNPKAVEKFMGKLTKHIDKINNRALINTVRNVQKKVKKLPKTTPANIRELGVNASTIDHKYLSPESLKTYLEVLTNIGNTSKGVTSEAQSTVNVEEAMEQLETLREEVEKAKIEEIKETLEDLGVDFKDLGMSDADLKTFWETEFDVTDPDDKLSDTLEKAEAMKEKLLELAEDYKSDLQDYDSNDLSPQERKILSKLKGAKLGLMSPVALKQYVRVVQNITMNGNFSGSGSVMGQIAATENIVEFAKFVIKRGIRLDNIGLNAKGNSEAVWNNAKSLALLMRQVFKDPQLMAEFDHYSGLQELSKARTEAENRWNDVEKRAGDFYKSMVKAGFKKIKSAENSLVRGIVSNLMQGTTPQEFEINKQRLERTISTMKVTNSARQTEMVQAIYDEYKDFTSQEEVINHLKSKNDGNYEVVEFWMKEFEDIREDLKANTELVYNQVFKELLENYLPIRVVKGVGVKEDTPQGGATISNPKAAGSTVTRTNKRLSKGDRVNLDFERVMESAMKDNLSDIATSLPTLNIKSFFTSPMLESVIGRQNVIAFANRINYMQDLSSGKLLEKSEMEKAGRKLEKVIRRIAVVRALGSVSSIVKQSIPVVVGSVIQRGGNPVPFFKWFGKAQNNDLIKMYSTSLRGNTMGGELTYIDKISEESSSRLGRAFDRLTRPISKLNDRVSTAIMKPLSTGDAAVAKASWVMYYMEYLEKNGVDTNSIKDLDNEAQLIEGDEVRQKAAAYAEVRVEETQVSSSTERAAPIFSNPHIGLSVIRSYLAAYQQFNLNAKFRMLNDISILTKNLKKPTGQNYTEDELLDIVVKANENETIMNKIGTQAARKSTTMTAWKSLTATVFEQMAFQGLKSFLLVYWAKGLGSMVSSIFGFDDEDEEIDFAFKMKQFYSAIAKDLNPLVMGTLAEDTFIDGLNYLAFINNEDDYERYAEWEKAMKEDGGLPWYRYNKKGTDYGVYSGALDIAKNITQNIKMIDGEAYVTDDYGNEKLVEVSDNELTFMRFMLVMEVLSGTTGVEADSYRAAEKIRKEIIKNNAK